MVIAVVAAIISVSGFIIYQDSQANTGGLQGEVGILRADGTEKIVGRELIPFSTWGIGGAKLEAGDSLYCKAWLQIQPEGFPARLEEVDLTVKYTINGGPAEETWGSSPTGDIPKTHPVEVWWVTPLPEGETTRIPLLFRNVDARWTSTGYVGGVSYWSMPVEDIDARLSGLPDGDYVFQVTYIVNMFSVTWNEYGSEREEAYWYEGNPGRPVDSPFFSSVLIVDIKVTKTSPTLSVSVSSESGGSMSLRIQP